MIGSKSQAQSKPTALGTMLQASTYGQTIPTIYGTTLSNLLVIWAANIRAGMCIGKKKKSKKKGQTPYVENIDFLIGSNPIDGVLQIWSNAAKLGLNFIKQDFVTPFSEPASLTITDPHFYFLLAVTVDRQNQGTFADYGSQVYGAGAIGNAVAYVAGSGYAVNDTFTIGGPGSGAFGHVTAVSGGAVTGIAIDNPGTGYTVAVHTTTATSGVGTGLTINVTSLGTPYNDTSEYALFNIAQHGPDLIDAGYSKFFPYVYKWRIADGATFYLPFVPNGFFGPGWGIPGGQGTFHAYYAQLTNQIYYQSPAARLCLTFEPSLGDGPEYSGFASQQIVYPEYAGMGSPDIDLGSSGTIPSIRPEVRGSFARFQPRGDADFCDMIEDTIKSGMLQTGSQLGLIQRGVNLNEMPGVADKVQFWSSLSPSNTGSAPQTGFSQPIKKGQTLFVCCRWRTESTGTNLTVSDSAGNAWTPVFVTNYSGMWTAVAAADHAAGNLVSVLKAGAVFYDLALMCGVMDQGSDTVDATATASGTMGSIAGTVSCAITVTGAPTYIVAYVNSGLGFPAVSAPFGWTNLFPSLTNIIDTLNGAYNDSLTCYRVVAAPGTYTFTMKVSANSPWQIGLAAIKQSQPPPYPKALGNILDNASLNVVRAQCQAAGLWGSVTMNSQQAASDWLKQFYQCADAAPVWSGFILKSIARSEVSAVGNGVVYTAPTASGPAATLTESDLIGDSSGPLVTVERKAQVDANNILQVQFFDRNSDYNQSMVSEPLSGPIALFGPRKEAPAILPMIQDPLVARKILAVEVRRKNLLRNVYSFKMKAKWAALEAMDLILINDSKVNISNLPVRLTKMVENDKFELECEAEPFVYGCNAPNPSLVVTSAAPYTPNTTGDPGSVNAPIIFEPVPRLTSQQNQAQIWAVVSGSSANYGGCVVLLSTDGGASYKTVGQISGNATTGYTVGDWPIANDPDTTNDLSVDLTESLGTLSSYSVNDEDAFVYPCYVAPGLAAIPYELMTYAVATLTAANKYTLKATGGGTNHLRRAVFSAPQPATGVDHPNNSRFALLNPSGVGIFKMNMDPLWAGKTLHFKFLAVNTFGLQAQQASAATDYTYTPTGSPAAVQNPNANNYSLTGGALTNPTSTTIHMAQATATFPSNTAVYNARTFTIAAPSVPTTYYVTISDAAQLGDEGTGTTLTATCQTSNALVGVAGNVYIGSIVALPAGGGTVTGSGGASPGGANGDEILVNGT